MYLPIGLFGVSIAAASTPALSRLAAAQDLPRMRSTVGSAIGLMLTLNVPATIGLIALAKPIIALIFEHGSFTPADTAATALALRFYAIGLVGYSVVRIVSPTFYALHRSRIPVIASIASVIANVVLNLVLVRVMGYAGLALGTSLAALVNAGDPAAAPAPRARRPRGPSYHRDVPQGDGGLARRWRRRPGSSSAGCTS